MIKWIWTTLAIALSSYWLLFASPRYISEAHIIIQKTDLSAGQTTDLSSLLTGTNATSRSDQLLLRDYLRSMDMLKLLDATFNLKAHYSDTSKDFASRLWFDSIEWVHRYYLSRISVEYDEYAGVLVIQSQAYTPEMAQNITQYLVDAGERFMNQLAHKLAQDQVVFLEKQTLIMKDKALQTRMAVLRFQNEQGLVSPQETLASLNAVIANLEAQRTTLETEHSNLATYLVAKHPDLIKIEQQLGAVEKQIKQEQRKLASTKGKALNQTVEEIQRLELEANFAQEMYQTALASLEKGRIEAARTIKKVSILQQPQLAEYALAPERLYNTLLSLLIVLLLAGMTKLSIAIVRDHRE